MGDYDFLIDCTYCMDLYLDLNEGEAALKENVSEIYNEIGNMNEGWKGSSYDQFKANCDSVRKSFDSISDIIYIFNGAMSNQFLTKVSEKANKVKKTFKNITGE